jgi:hypothetical protein
MKKYVLFLITLFAGLNLFAQRVASSPYVVSEPKVLNYVSIAADTINKDDVKWFYYASSNVITDTKIHAKIEQARSYSANKPKVRLFQQYSMDNVEWYHLDSASTINGARGAAVTAKVQPYANYYRVGIKGIDSVQTTSYKLNLLIVNLK